jgi:hypothetical protein
MEMRRRVSGYEDPTTLVAMSDLALPVCRYLELTYQSPM